MFKTKGNHQFQGKILNKNGKVVSEVASFVDKKGKVMFSNVCFKGGIKM